MVKECLIIGGGPAGTAAAYAAVDAGLRSVVLVERDALGGTCTNRGCIPTKLLLAKTAALAAAGAVPPVDRDRQWGGFLRHKQALVDGLSRSIEVRCREKGVELLRGSAAFVSPNEVEVANAESGARTVLAADRIVVAVGSAPAQLPGSPCDGVSVISSDEALALTPLPQTMVVIGSGSVGAEFALLFTRLGVKVTVIEAAQRLFPAEEPEVDALFRAVYGKIGVATHTGDPVARIEPVQPGARGAVVTLASGSTLAADVVLVAAGRALLAGSLNCAAAGLEVDPRGAVRVSDELATSQPHIFAAGDVTGRMLLAHAATFMGRCAGRRAAGLPPEPVPYASIPHATFTAPEVAAVGLTAAAAAAAGLDCEARLQPMMESVKARIDRATDGFFKVVSERATGRIVGATAVGHGAAEIIHVLALAVHQRMTRSDLAGFCFAHPTQSELIGDMIS